ncbi:LysR family glycine cleavage system transcriptional activator [Sphingomonas jejuensis]|uniref:LysR family glycine cleavage system transcriptional activator n=1 Tax=Sphingomonas jejuensis TaxID=904715 RepID=A0ABX0XLV2_9SPHN|nr:LysR substrate-binding domain-containing protein [Sphingomonas jejuensis]NJC34225.1 LysR family glycine cleavage system transcriptional activator [Sphingomonas jejuensis]
MRRLPPLTAIEAFVQVARTGSIKAAADELALSSPALSRRVQALERFAGRQLLNRTHSGVRPNADGERFLASIVPALDAMSDAITDLTGNSDEMRLRLGVLPLFASQQLLPRLPSLRHRHPTLHLDVDTGGHGLVRLGDTLDVAITLDRSIDPALYARRINTDIIYPIASRRLTEGRDALRQPTDLARATVLLHRDMGDTLPTFLHHLGLDDLEPLAIDHFDSGQLMLEAAAEGLGVAFMHESHFLAARDDRLVRLFDVRVESPYSYWFACRPRALDARPVRLFHDWLFEDR